MKIYTRTGDKGTTSLVGGTRVAKDHPRLEAYGTVDELMAHTAYLRDNMENHPQLTRYRDELLQVLDHLMRLSSYLATEEEAKKYLPAFDGTQVALLEQWIDGIQSTLPTIDKFTLPAAIRSPPSAISPVPYAAAANAGHFPERTISCQ